MSTAPTALASVAPKDPPPTSSHQDRTKAREDRSELEELGKSLSDLREKLETALDTVKSGYDSLRARSLSAATQGLLKGAELQKVTSFLLASHKTLENFEKYVNRFTYAELTREWLFGKTEREREEAKEKLGYTIFKDTSSELLKFARQVGLLSEKISARDFLIKILGKRSVLLLEGAELPVTVFLQVLSPTELGHDELYGPEGYYTIKKQQECKQLVDNNASHAKVNKCMAEVLSLQRGEPLQSFTRKKPSKSLPKQRIIHSQPLS